MQTCASNSSNSSAHHVPALHQECRSRSAAVSASSPLPSRNPWYQSRVTSDRQAFRRHGPGSRSEALQCSELF
ncbi:hypothetical protein JG688_00004434 [Phytophthora aleatoria]|uniref:Uncharacterized protein n=1 Tax=Phytophthora aleatoria TaxID=2496075 RepID=A0A8J5J1W4_9STRA|nr:hypothetical protein JG688_00004434 [Phytophthora aleatoria]